MPTLIPPLSQSQLEIDILERNARVLRCAQGVHALASQMKREFEQFWLMPTDRLLALLNADVPTTLAIFAANTALANAVNESLDLTGRSELSTRVPTEFGRHDIAFVDGQFVQQEPPAEP